MSENLLPLLLQDLKDLLSSLQLTHSMKKVSLGILEIGTMIVQS